MDYKELMKYTQKITVLYAEDEEEVALINEDFFKVLFKDVVSVSNGLDAVREYEEHKNKFDLIILDIEMPIMNGFEAGKKIRLINPNQKIIFFTGFDNIKYIQEALELGGNEYMLKPFDENEFIEKIYNLVIK